ncbi:MAG: hypothetical protein H6747_13165 [Deltaproteobacteria bacterium]|nr:hypothetical protein [Deltaproteobacteria bacterium]
MALGSNKRREQDGWGVRVEQAKPRLDESFLCERRESEFALHECMTDYVNANALMQKGSPCFRCQTGLENRARFAKEG